VPFRTSVSAKHVSFLNTYLTPTNCLTKQIPVDRLISMNKFLATLLISFSLISFPSWAADFKKGVFAYESGDYETALREWVPLAEQGDINAQTNLGFMYSEGQGVPQDYNTAVKWYTLAAEQGGMDAQTSLGWMYKMGDGVPQDYKTAAKWYTLAAEQGAANGQFVLGLMYENGEGVLQDYKTAAKWYTLAAEQGFEMAQFFLGLIYLNGYGILQDLVYAHMWLNIAAYNGYEAAAFNRDIAAKQMTPSQLEKAQNLARECVAKDYKGC